MQVTAAQERCRAASGRSAATAGAPSPRSRRRCTTRSSASGSASRPRAEERDLHPAVRAVDRREAVDLAARPRPPRCRSGAGRAGTARPRRSAANQYCTCRSTRNGTRGRRAAAAPTRPGRAPGARPCTCRRRCAPGRRRRRRLPAEHRLARSAGRRRAGPARSRCAATVASGPDEPGPLLVERHLVRRRGSASGTGGASRRRRASRAAGPTARRCARLPATVVLSGGPTIEPAGQRDHVACRSRWPALSHSS